MKTLKTFLEKYGACTDGFEFAKNLTLEQFLETCPRGDWILWLFVRTNPESLKELTLAKAHCANTVRHLMTDKRSLKAVDVALAFGEGMATREELDAAYAAASVASVAAYSVALAFGEGMATREELAAYSVAVYAAASVAAYSVAAYAADSVAAYAADSVAASAAKKQNQKQTADICRKFLPLEIWDQSQF